MSFDCVEDGWRKLIGAMMLSELVMLFRDLPILADLNGSITFVTFDDEPTF
jgi:hypothetical protein